MKSRAELDKELRTMQFLVERACPMSDGKADESKLPVLIWVQLGEVIPGGPYDCGVRQYLVSLEQAAPIRMAHGKDSPAPSYRVCDHMGRLFE